MADTAERRGRKAEVRQRILKAAFHIVADDGFRAAQVAAVASAAGIATGTLYLYFPSKADLFAELFRQASSHEVGVLAQIADVDAPAGERLDSIVRTFVHRAVRGHRLAYALIAEPVDPAVEAERIESKRAYARVFAKIVRDGIAAGEFPPQQIDITAACLIGALAEAMVGPLTPETFGDAAGEEELASGIAAFMRRAVMGASDNVQPMRGTA